MAVMANQGRRGFFKRLGRVPQLPRRLPPWTVGADAFAEHCTRCGDCIAACEPAILIVGDGGFPSIDFTLGACTFCRACVDVCAEPCFAAGQPWQAVAQVTDACIEMRGVTCRLCEDACEVDAIRFRPRLGGGAELRIDTERCNGCGACVSPCPAGAIAPVEPGPQEVRT